MRKKLSIAFVLGWMCLGGKLLAHPTVYSDSVPVFPDMLYEYRFAVLDKKTPIELDYNPQVRRYIEIFTIDRRKDLSKILGLSKLYFPVFEAYLDKYDLPLELKYLAVVESGLDPLAKSPSGAVGLWQFLYHSASMFNLQIDSYVDERRDLFKSTDAACRYFRYLYQTFNNWQLVLAAYNGGPGVVRNAIERSGGKSNLWDLLPYLPEPTQNYVPAFLAMNYIMAYASDFKIEETPAPYSFDDIDTVYIDYSMSFSQISQNLKISEDNLRLLNPGYKLDVIPETGNKQMLVLPKSLIKPYLAYENSILSTTSQSGAKAKLVKQTYKVQKGDFLHKIAMKYNCLPEDIRRWNHLSNDFISPGQELIVWISAQ
jgi:membrane-bound lytic murein transglycosylase D